MAETPVNETLLKVISLCYQMLELADHGDTLRQDIECGVVYGSLRDAAYKIRQMAEDELTRHKNFENNRLINNNELQSIS